jgi:integrase/recombinase XerD
MSKLSMALDEYLKVRRALGYKLHMQGRQLRQFVEFADRAGADFITTELALEWAIVCPSPADLADEAIGYGPPIRSAL